MNKKIKFSIVVATKDRPDDIDLFLKSLKESEILHRADTEVIIVDNNSVDLSVKNICSNYNVRYIFEPHTGKAFALNTGINLAEGEFIVFTDDDVVITEKNWLDELYVPFQNRPLVKYVSGNVLAANLASVAQKQWEKKGGLSKGSLFKYFDRAYLNSFKFIPWPLTKICAGANSIIDRQVLLDLGGICTLFGPGAMIGHGESLEVGYRLINAGYELCYTPTAIVRHRHPISSKSIKKKLFNYAVGDTAIHMYIFLKYRDYRSLFWAFGGHQLYVFKNMFKRIIGKYALPLSYLIYTLVGSSLGGMLFLYKYYKNK